MLINSDGLPWFESHFKAKPAAFWPSKWTNEIGDAMFLVPQFLVRATWIQVSGDQFVVPETWAENLGRAPSTLCPRTRSFRSRFIATFQETVIGSLAPMSQRLIRLVGDWAGAVTEPLRQSVLRARRRRRLRLCLRRLYCGHLLYSCRQRLQTDSEWITYKVFPKAYFR